MSAAPQNKSLARRPFGIEFVLGGADVVVIKLPVTYGVTILQLKEQLCYAALASECGFDEVQLFAAKLKLLRGGTLLKDELTLRLAGLHDGARLVVESLKLAPARRPAEAETSEFVTLNVPLGAIVFRGTESKLSLTKAIHELLVDYVPDASERAAITDRISFTAADGAAAPQAVREMLEVAREDKGIWKGVLGVVCCIHILHDAFLDICVKLSVPCPAWNRDSHNSVTVWFLEQISTTLHNHHTILGLDGFAVIIKLGMETRWNSYGDVAAAVFTYRVVIRLRVRAFLEDRETLDGGGVELDEKARLVLWAALAGVRRGAPSNEPEAGACSVMARVGKGPRAAALHGF